MVVERSVRSDGAGTYDRTCQEERDFFEIIGSCLVEVWVANPWIIMGCILFQAVHPPTLDAPSLCVCLSLYGNFPPRHASEAGSDAVPSLSLRACHWVDRCLWFAATGAAGVVATPGAPGVLNNANGVFVSGGWGHGAAANSDPPQPELVEALFQLMKEWVVELPVPSLRCEGDIV